MLYFRVLAELLLKNCWRFSNFGYQFETILDLIIALGFILNMLICLIQVVVFSCSPRLKVILMISINSVWLLSGYIIQLALGGKKVKNIVVQKELVDGANESILNKIYCVSI